MSNKVFTAISFKNKRGLLPATALTLALLAGGLSIANSASDTSTGTASPTPSSTPAQPHDAKLHDPGPAFPGGMATWARPLHGRNAFSRPSATMKSAFTLEFRVGDGIFRKLWVSAPSSTRSSDGLGPLFNARSCQRCHLKDGRGHPPADHWPKDDAVSMFLRLSIPPQNDRDRQALASHRQDVIPDPVYGGQLQDLAIQGHKAEGHMRIDYTDEQVKLRGGEIVSLRRPHYSVTGLAFGPLHKDVMLSPRIAPQMIGLGLLQAVPAAQIRALADPDDANGDGISGKARIVWSLIDNRPRLGRFGWKAGTPYLAEQNAHAFAGDMGLSTPLLPAAHSGECTKNQTACRQAPNGAGKDSTGRMIPEVRKQMFDMLTFYTANLSVPRRRQMNDPQVKRGEAIFKRIGCPACHRPTLTTGPVRDKRNSHLAFQVIHPYTDMLLHDMGDGLADHRPEGNASGSEWRTAPLWGIGLTRQVSGHTFFLHDGRARSLKEAIIWHGGEAQPARDRFIDLPPEERAALIAFVNSL